MSDCMFCRIVAGQVAAERVLETPGVMAFLDVFPAARGHTLVVPRVHAATLPELGVRETGELFAGVRAVIGRIEAAFGPQGFHVGWNQGAAAGQHVFHLHVHVIPRFGGGGRGIQTLGEGCEKRDLAEVGAALRAVGAPRG